ncbi:MAG: pilus assembly protein PilP, partial [Bdellovibrionia bacterium]
MTQSPWILLILFLTFPAIAGLSSDHQSGLIKGQKEASPAVELGSQSGELSGIHPKKEPLSGSQPIGQAGKNSRLLEEGLERIKRQEQDREQGLSQVLSIEEQIIHLRDPFRMPEAVVPRVLVESDLEKYSLGDLKLLAVLTGPSRIRAILKTPDGKTVIAGPEDRIGKNGGKIFKIKSDGIVVREKILNVYGKKENSDTLLGLGEKDRGPEPLSNQESSASSFPSNRTMNGLIQQKGAPDSEGDDRGDAPPLGWPISQSRESPLT